ncbi:hypothetical protein [Methylocella sp.]|uniref:hypothetical protein n=1 Tax=Methylocella sp. TaxID=1978226 RepID=UPI0037851343
MPALDRLSFAPQLTLDLAPAPGYGAEDFFIAPSNEAAARLIDAWPDWPDPALLLTGPAGSGKSHLGAIWAARAGARRIRAAELAAPASATLAPADLARERALLVEDLDTLGEAGGAPLFHLLNLARERPLPLLLTARRAPELLEIGPPDLVSRLRLAPRASLGAPDDDLMRMTLAKLLSDRQLAVDPRFVDYAAARLSCSMDAARRFVEAVDREALARKSRVTRQIAARVLAALDAGEASQDGEADFGEG